MKEQVKTWLLIAEVATRFRRSPRTIRRWIDEEKLIAGKPEKASNAGILVLGQSVVDFERRMVENLKEDSEAVDKQMQEIMRPRRKVFSRGV